jgi:cell division septation protein DedD
MADDKREDGTGAQPEPGAESQLPRLWGEVNEAARSGHLFDSNLPLPIPEPPGSVPNVDDTLEDRQRQSPAKAVGPLSRLPAIGPFDGPANPMAPSGPDWPGESADPKSRHNKRASLRYGAGAVVGAAVLIASSLLVLAGGDENGSTSTTDTTPPPTTAKPIGIETSTASLNAGDCVIVGPYEIDDPFHTAVSVVPCSKPHDAEVVAAKTTPMDLHEDIEPADIASTATFLCQSDFDLYSADNLVEDRVQLAPLVGTRRALLVCIARYPGGKQFLEPTPASTNPAENNAADSDE